MSKQSNKGLQKFTDFEQLKTVEDFNSLQKKDNKKFLELFNWIQDKINENVQKENSEEREIDKYFNRIEMLLPILDRDKTETDKQLRIGSLKRERWYLNDALIKGCIDTNVMKKGVLPNNTAICRETGLSRVTIYNHLKENGHSLYREEELEKFKVLNNLAITRIYKIGMSKNDPKALKMFVDLTGEPKKTVINNNYIQINNTRIDSLLIDQLPIETKNQIEALILNNRLI